MKKIPLYGLVPGLLAGAGTAVASSDYDPAIWQSSCNANYYTSGNGHHFCVIHDMEGYYLSTISYFASCGHTSSSIHYLVNGKQDISSDHSAGELSQMVSEGNYAWHVICWNTWMWGTEHEGFESNPAWYTDAMYQTSGALQHHLCGKNGLPEDRNHIIGHGEWQSSAWRSWMSSAYPSIDTGCNTHTDPGSYWDWSKLMSYVQGDGGGGGLPTVAGPDACSWGAGRIDVVVRGGGDAIYHKYFVAGTGWLPSGGFERMNGYSTAGPSICSWGANRLDAFCRGTDNSLQHNYSTGSGWAGWGPQGGTMASTPDACCWGPNRIDIVTRYSDNNVYHTWWDGTTWHGYENLGGGNCSSAPTICSWASGRLDVFYRGSDNALWHKYYSTGGWSGWQNLGGNFKGAPDAACWGSGRIDIVARGTGDDVVHTYYDTSDGKGWTHGWDSLGGTTIGSKCSVAASTSNSGRLDVFCVGTDSQLYWKYYDRAGGGWAASWSAIGGQIQ